MTEGFQNARTTVIDFAAVLHEGDCAVASTAGERAVGHSGKHANRRSVDQIVG